MAKKKLSKEAAFAKLTWNDLGDWAGQKILSRGKGYQRGKHVDVLSVTTTGAIVAWVRGGKRYATLVDIEDGDLTSTCTCPFGSNCKHAVATVLEYLESLKNKIVLPVVAVSDQRLVLLNDTDDENDDDGDDYYDDEECAMPARGNGCASKPLRTYLDGLSKEQLVETISELASTHVDVSSELGRRKNLKEGSISKVVRAIKNEIHALSEEPAWSNHWNGEGNIPDYSGVEKGMKDLLKSGHADEVVDVGEILLKEGVDQIESSNDEGETAEGIAACMDVVFIALSKSSRSKVDQMVWAVEAELKDGFDICSGVERFWKQKQKTDDWCELADRLLQRLKNSSCGGVDDHHHNYKRDCLTDCIVTALENAGRREEIVPLCEREAVKTQSYQRLVDRLMEDKRTEEAEQWIQKGIEVTQSKLPGIARGLRDTLKKIREKKGDWKTVALLRSEDFFNQPSLKNFRELEKSAERAGEWPKIKVCAMEYLETGKIPSTWPLSKPSLSGRWHPKFPDTETLIDIAISDKRTEDVIRWYNVHRSSKRGFFSSFKDIEVANAIVGSHPDKALSIWKSLAEWHVAQTKPSEYRTAATHLNKIQRTLKKLGKEGEWQQYRSALRQANIRKTSFVAILDGMSGRAIIEGSV